MSFESLSSSVDGSSSLLVASGNDALPSLMAAAAAGRTGRSSDGPMSSADGFSLRATTSPRKMVRTESSQVVILVDDTSDTDEGTNPSSSRADKARGVASRPNGSVESLGRPSPPPDFSSCTPLPLTMPGETVSKESVTLTTRTSCVNAELLDTPSRSDALLSNETTPVTTAPSASASPPESLSDEQRLAFDLVVHQWRNVFITGGAGTGKSHLLRTIIQALPASTTFVTATTGIAALNLGGTTLHSFAGCGLVNRTTPLEEVYNRVSRSRRRIAVWRRCHVLVVDEVSMLDSWFLDALDYVARKARNRPYDPFGGIQLVLSGDFLQLPPVSKDSLHAGSSSSPRSCYCFESEAWLHIAPEVCLLTRPYRQADPAFFVVLNEMRLGDLRAESTAILHSLSSSTACFVKRVADVKTETPTVGYSCNATVVHTGGSASAREEGASVHTSSHVPARFERIDEAGHPATLDFDGYTILRPRRSEVDRENSRYYDRLTTPEYCYHGFHVGEGQYPKQHLSEAVGLREGCRVMLIKNFDATLGMVNGATGIVTGFVDFRKGYDFHSHTGRSDAARVCCRVDGKERRTHGMLPVVRFDSKVASSKGVAREVVVEPQEWVEMQGSVQVCRSVQIPLIVAYAITIHKSQGMSLTHVDIDLHHIFESGQAYVALSRCVSLDGLRLHGFSAHVVTPDPTALAYYRALDLQQQRIRWRRKRSDDKGHAERACCTPCGYDTLPCGMSDAVELDEQGSGMAKTFDVGEARPNGVAALPDTDTLRLDTLRRRISALLEMVHQVQHMVNRHIVPAYSLREVRLVLDIGPLLTMVASDGSVRTYTTIFGDLGNMIRVPAVVKKLLVEAAALRDSCESTREGTGSSPNPLSRDDNREALDVLKAADIAAEALVLLESAKADFIGDEQREGQRLPLPVPLQSWRRYEEVLPLLQSSPPACEQALSQAAANDGGEIGIPRDFCEVDFLLNRDPREATQHKSILEYAMFLRETYGGQGMAVCTESPVLAASALAFGFRVASLGAPTS